MRNVFPLAIAGLTVVTAPALAQNRSISSRGTGSISLPQRAATPLYDVRFNQSGRTVTLVLVGKATVPPYTIEAQITGSTSGNALPVQVTSGFRDMQTRGSGRIVLAGNSLASIDLRGTVKDGAFSIEFRGEGTDAGGGGGGPGFETGARPINQSTTGNGTLDVAGRRYNLREMRIRLHDDGRAELRFEGDRSVDGRGTWRRGLNGRADIAFDQWNGQRTTGTGLVSFNGRDIQRVNATVASQNSRADFYPGQPGGGGGDWDGNTGARPINMSTRGSGTYELSGRRYDLDEMRIRLRDDGRAELRFDGERGAGGSGTWRRGSNGRADIDLIEWEGRRTGGSASVTFRGSEIERVGVNVPAQGSRVEFYPGRTGGGRDEAQPVNTSFRGTGLLRDRGRTYQLNEASIRLRDNGDAEISFSGQRQSGGRGRWDPNGAVANISITEWDGRKANGRGSITFVRNLPTQVNLSVQGRSITFNTTPQIQPR